MGMPVGFLARVTCKQCGVSALVEHTDFQSAVACTCCTTDHNHDEAANSCPGIESGHEGVPCAEVNAGEDGVNCIRLTPEGEPCPGNHCGAAIEDCTVCRPLTIDILQLGAPLGVT